MKKISLVVIFIVSATVSFFIEKYFFNSFFPETEAQKYRQANHIASETENFLGNNRETAQFITEEEYQKIVASQKAGETDKKKKKTAEKEVVKIKEVDKGKPIIQPVFFTSQAPSGQWHNEIFQDGCEEASMLMAINWADNGNKQLSKKDAEKIIEDISLFEKKKYGFYLDVSLMDVYKVIQDYYHHENMKFIEEFTKADLINNLYQQAVIIIPANGQMLGNPYFVPPGPAYHTLLIIGYDPQKKQFIVNDPGTRRGDHYHYPEDVLFRAIRDYPSGYHQTIKENHKRAIVIYKKD